MSSWLLALEKTDKVTGKIKTKTRTVKNLVRSGMCVMNSTQTGIITSVTVKDKIMKRMSASMCVFE